jgi:hypothetical protein
MDLSNYVDVATRLKLALEKWPDLRVQETGREIIDLNGKPMLICTVTVWRSPDDPIPSIASAAEPIPGRTKFSQDSEVMVGFTSALGRAIGYMGVGLNGSIASANEVNARRDDAEGPTSPSEPRRAPVGSNAPQSGDGPSQAQLRMLQALKYTGPTPRNKREASGLIDTLKQAQQALDEMREAPEDPF